MCDFFKMFLTIVGALPNTCFCPLFTSFLICRHSKKQYNFLPFQAFLAVFIFSNMLVCICFCIYRVLLQVLLLPLNGFAYWYRQVALSVGYNRNIRRVLKEQKAGRQVSRLINEKWSIKTLLLRTFCYKVNIYRNKPEQRCLQNMAQLSTKHSSKLNQISILFFILFSLRFGYSIFLF